MTDEKFTELVNLYFDKEISADEIEELKIEIATCPDRKRAFAERCRLHKAMRLALEPKGGAASSHIDKPFIGSSAGQFPRWILGTGVAASLLIAFLLVSPVFRHTTEMRIVPELVGEHEASFGRSNLLEDVGKPEWRRYAVARQQREAKYHASLVAQMRLMGLRPELTPEEKELRHVAQTAYYEPKHEVNQAELFQRLQAQKLIPEPQLLRFETTESHLEPDVPGVFQSSLSELEEF